MSTYYVLYISYLSTKEFRLSKKYRHMLSIMFTNISQAYNKWSTDVEARADNLTK